MKILKSASLVLIGMMVFVGFFGTNVFAEGEENNENSLSDMQINTIIDHCDTIKDSLKSLQRADSRTRVYLGRYYETILTNFITPLNLRLVENNISNTALLENQTNFANKRSSFVSDFIIYQQALEELVNINCKSEPARFYEKLLVAREKRKIVNKDVTKLKAMTDEQVKLVETLKNGQ
ncbi:hypothetical protein IJI18_01760 [Candidatus Saccharibacteria bacterium]|nr:hypothetical protein [Candidatus Saccharibacteria bacterium]